MSELVEHIKHISLGAMEAGSPVNILFGTVVTSSPLQIDVEQRMLLGPAQLVVCQSLTDYILAVDIHWASSTYSRQLKITGSTDKAGEPEHTHTGAGLSLEPSSLSHSHTISGLQTIEVKNALQPGDMVVLMRMQGGQTFFVMDRMVSA